VDPVKAGSLQSAYSLQFRYPTSGICDSLVTGTNEKETAKAEQELSTFIGDKKAMEAEIALLRRRIPDIEMAIEKLHMELSTGDKLSPSRTWKQLQAQPFRKRIWKTFLLVAP
jgi:hypothetical protein